MLLRPKLKPQDFEYLRAYQTLEDGRGMGMTSPHPIAVSEIESLCNLSGIASRSERLKYLRLMRRLDRVYLDHWSEQQAPR